MWISLLVLKINSHPLEMPSSSNTIFVSVTRLIFLKIQPTVWQLSDKILFRIQCTTLADNVRERRDFEDDEVKSHLGLSSAQPFNCKWLIRPEVVLSEMADTIKAGMNTLTTTESDLFYFISYPHQ